ncbi:MAG: winged helix-turn-helix domain-containing protein [Candidatus Hodarchaeota archaeon]
MDKITDDQIKDEKTSKKLLSKIQPAFKVWLEIDTPSGPRVLLGEGKAELLRAIVTHGSINAAAEAQKIGFRTAWKLLQEIDESVRSLGEEFAVIESQRGGKAGGGTSVTACGVTLVQFLQEIEERVSNALKSLK